LKKWENRDTGNISVDKSTLKYIAEDNSNIEARNLAKNILEYRKYNTLFTTFNEGLLNSLNNGRIHCNFHGQGTRTSRFASSNPNLQNQPKLPFIKDDYDSSLRALYIPNEGDVLCGADFSQIELRMMAELSRDPSMVKVYLEDLDLHRMTADLVGCIRDAAKIINFGIGYGYTAIGLMEGINDKVEEEHKVDEFKAQELINRFWGAYPKVKALFDYVDKSLYETHYVRDIIGRKRRWGIISNSSLREAHNYLIQASAGELMKMAMVDLYNKKDHKRSQFLLTVHDELIVSAHPSYIYEFKELMTDCMVNVIKTTVPLKISLKVGKNWSECK
jgi:DNA polymerase-1